MKTLCIVIPIKDPTNAKSRLSSVLSPEQRKQLAVILFEQLLKQLRSLEIPILVVTESEMIIEIATTHQADILKLDEAKGETDAVERAATWCTEQGFASQLVLPGDMAHLDEGELQTLLSKDRPSPSLILCPATDEDGTNAILSTPPCVLPFRFGDASFPDYQKRAAEQNIPCNILRLPSFLLDIDTPNDLQTFLNQSSPHPAKEFLKCSNLL